MEQENLLVKQAQQGDVHAFAQLYECCYRDLYRFALYNLGQEEDEMCIRDSFSIVVNYE